jgi:two-component system chemotaxis response regulator CheY
MTTDNPDVELMEKGKAGDPEAQTQIGELLELGIASFCKGPDLAAARSWYELAAKKGHHKAQFALARMCEVGVGGPKNMNDAEHWYELAAQGGLVHPDMAKELTLAASRLHAGKPVRTVLLLENSTMQQGLIGAILERMSFKVRIAENGRQGLQIFKADPTIKVVLCDLHMPEMDGLTFLSSLRSHREGGDVPCIMISGDSDPASIIKAKKLGIKGWILKPITRKSLSMELKKIFP